MSDYGPPPGPPEHFGPPPGPPEHFGPPPGGSAGSAVTPRSDTDPAQSGSTQQVAMLSYAAAALGLLGFIWGFLDWLSSDNGGGSSSSATGYESLGSAVVGLLLAAGLLAAALTLENKDITLAPAAVAVAALLVAFGVLVDHGDGYSAEIGLILAFITAILQAAALILAWLMATKRMAALGGGSSGKAAKSAGQWQQGPGPQYGGGQGQFGPAQGPPPGYGPPQQGGQPSYGQPPGMPPGPQGPQGYGPPPQGGPAYGPPPGAPQGPPQGATQGPPPGPPQGYGPPPQQGPSPSGGDDASRTQVLPRFQPDQNSTQQGIPIFDPQSRPDERPADRPGE